MFLRRSELRIIKNMDNEIIRYGGKCVLAKVSGLLMGWRAAFGDCMA
jgi:hypothetical protein